MKNEKLENNAPCVKWSTDCFNGIVAIFEDVNIMSTERFWVEQQRKDVYTDHMSLEEAEKQMQAFIDDTMF